MKFFNWMQNKFNGRSDRNPLNNDDQKKAPHGLLAIGTFGNNDMIEQEEEEEEEEQLNPTSASSSPDLSDFSPEEVGKLQKELTKLLKRKPAKQEEESPNLPLDRFLNCPSSLEVSRRISNPDPDIERTISVIIGKCKEVRAEKSKNVLGKKSLSLLLKKVFVCANGFSPAPSFRDTLQESRMEKLLRTILRKKIYPQTCSRTSSRKRYLEDKPNVRERKDEDESEEKSRSCKWDKTDSEYIVLEV